MSTRSPSPASGEDPRPVFLVAGAEASRPDTVSLADLLGILYRRRVLFVALFLVTMVSSMAWALNRPGTKSFRFAVSVAWPGVTGLKGESAEPDLASRLAAALAGQVAAPSEQVGQEIANASVSFPEVRSGNKVDALDRVVVVQLEAPGNSPVPESLVRLRDFAMAQSARLAAEETAVLAAAVEELEKELVMLRNDPQASSSVRSEVELAIARSRRVPPPAFDVLPIIALQAGGLGKLPMVTGCAAGSLAFSATLVWFLHMLGFYRARFG